MSSDRPDYGDLAFLLALGAVGLVTLTFLAERNGAAFVMSAICLVGIAAGRAVGIRGQTLLPLGLGLAFLVWVVWNYPPGGPHATSAFAHFFGGALAGWALAAALRPKLASPWWAILALLATVVLTGVWEVAEWVGDRVLDTGLVPNRRDSAFDIFFGIVGAFAGIALARFSTPGPPAR